MDLLHMPPEILLQICKHLDAKDISNLIKSCRTLASIGSENALWKTKATQIWGEWILDMQDAFSSKAISALETPEKQHINWKKICMKRVTTRAKHNLRQTVFEHESPVHCTDYNHEFLLSGQANGGLKIWNIRKRKRSMHTFFKHSKAITCVRFDRRSIVTGSADEKVLLWSLNSGDSDVLHKHTSQVTCLEFNSNSQIAASGSFDKNVIVSDLTKQTVIHRFNIREKVFSLFLKKSDNLLWVGSEGYLQNFDLRSSKSVQKAYLFYVKSVMQKGSLVWCSGFAPQQNKNMIWVHDIRKSSLVPMITLPINTELFHYSLSADRLLFLENQQLELMLDVGKYIFDNNLISNNSNTNSSNNNNNKSNNNTTPNKRELLWSFPPLKAATSICSKGNCSSAAISFLDYSVKYFEF